MYFGRAALGKMVQAVQDAQDLDRPPGRVSLLPAEFFIAIATPENSYLSGAFIVHITCADVFCVLFFVGCRECGNVNKSV